MNILALVAAAVVPLLVGAFWYSPLLFEKAWLKSIGKTKEDMEGGNMALIFGLTFILGIFLAFGLSNLTNHQSGVFQLFAMHPDFGVAGTEIQNLFETVMKQFGETHLHFGHGALHGGLGAILFALPLIAINALFERRGGKYIFIHFGYWFVTMILMGGVVCQFFRM